VEDALNLLAGVLQAAEQSGLDKVEFQLVQVITALASVAGKSLVDCTD